MGKGTSQQKKKTSKDIGPSKYENIERRQGRRFLFVWLPIIIVVVLSFYSFAFDPSRPVGQPVSGTSREGEQTRASDDGGKTFMVVLDDGRLVKLEGSHMGSLEAGRRVLVQENVTLIFKRKSFSFVRYIR
jgi:hypothetical protein